MKAMYLLFMCVFLGAGSLVAQLNCYSYPYLQSELAKDPSLAQRIEAAEEFTRQHIQSEGEAGRQLDGMVIRIPVVVHILYHFPEERYAISDAQVAQQLDILNQCFRRTNADTSNTPPAFKSLAADCEIEFHLAISDPNRKSTTGIIRKYTPIEYWEANDEMKFSASMGDDGWDPKQYLNIWVCNLKEVAGYSSFPNGPEEKDGVVISNTVFGPSRQSGMEMGRTAVHEVGHWLHLRHIWGDDYCGDDGVADTPAQGWYSWGCPTGTKISCTNGPNGDMYMNYMDFTNDACVNLFTLGQKSRMRSLFATGGPRSGIPSSVGLMPPLIFESPLPDDSPRWMQPYAYPNPAVNEVTVDLSYDPRWIGKTLRIINLNGQVLRQVVVTSKIQVVTLDGLQPGFYILSGKKGEDMLRHKFIKL